MMNNFVAFITVPWIESISSTSEYTISSGNMEATKDITENSKNEKRENWRWNTSFKEWTIRAYLYRNRNIFAMKHISWNTSDGMILLESYKYWICGIWVLLYHFFWRVIKSQSIEKCYQSMCAVNNFFPRNQQEICFSNMCFYIRIDFNQYIWDFFLTLLSLVENFAFNFTVNIAAKRKYSDSIQELDYSKDDDYHQITKILYKIPIHKMIHKNWVKELHKWP